MSFCKGRYSNSLIGQVIGLDGMEPIQVEDGFSHCLCLTKQGEVYSWGIGSNGRLGHGSTNNEPFPKKIEALPFIVKISAGGDNSLFLTRNLIPKK